MRCFKALSAISRQLGFHPSKQSAILCRVICLGSQTEEAFGESTYMPEERRFESFPIHLRSRSLAGRRHLSSKQELNRWFESNREYMNMPCERPTEYGGCTIESVRECTVCNRSLCYEHYVFHNDDIVYTNNDPVSACASNAELP